MKSAQSKKKKPYYEGDKNLSEMIRILLDNREKFLTDVDLFESNSDKMSFQKLVDEFEEYYYKDLTIEKIKKKSTKISKRKSDLVTRLFCMMRDKLELAEKDMSIAEDIQRNLIPDRVPKIDG
ncbi:MAG: hypothetical protein GY863_09920, partial [bacterium]|nr:hypothetical protein [bacterium]